MNWNTYLLIILLIWNTVVFFLYAMDKYRARHGSWRVPERVLLLCAFFCGGIGAVAGMCLLRHKTRHLKFRILLPITAILTAAVAVLIQWPELLAAMNR